MRMSARMNSRQKIIAGYIFEYFLDGKAPGWHQVGPALKEYDVSQLYGYETLPTEFLKVLFINNPHLLRVISDSGFNCRHHQIAIMLMKEEYSLSNCLECGHYTRNVGFNWRRRFASFQEFDEWEADKEQSVKEIDEVDSPTKEEKTPDTIILQPEEDAPDTPDGVKDDSWN